MHYQIEKHKGNLVLTNGDCDLLFCKDVTVEILAGTILEDLIEHNNPDIRTAYILKFKTQQKKPYCRISFELDNRYLTRMVKSFRFSLKNFEKNLLMEQITADDDIETITEATENAERIARRIWEQIKDKIMEIRILAN